MNDQRRAELSGHLPIAVRRRRTYGAVSVGPSPPAETRPRGARDGGDSTGAHQSPAPAREVTIHTALRASGAASEPSGRLVTAAPPAAPINRQPARLSCRRHISMCLAGTSVEP